MLILYSGDLPFVGIFNMSRLFVYSVCCVALGLASVSMQYIIHNIYIWCILRGYNKFQLGNVVQWLYENRA